MNEHSGYSGLQVLLAFITGATAGVVAALLLAPKSGRETREDVVGALRHGKDVTKRIPGAFKEAGGAAKEAFTKALEESP